MDSINFFLTIASYLLGSIPSGVLLSKVLGKGDLRKQGSGNIGATNAFRAGGKLLGGLTLLIDMAKGLCVILLANAFNEQYLTFYGFICIVGHIFPIWLKFEGGKGVATAFGVILGINPILGGFSLLLWILVFKVSRISSLAALVSLGTSVFIECIMITDGTNLIFLVISLILIIFRHKDNIMRLCAGKENKIPKQ
ncbi:glycerol-3-phosphate 1-O-acyltransferase PlsY [Candidatus Bandiella euplotis]|uniref:Glycerol-3-phosphate acyltransferase n=1 Tax=Candidatus Bandiella euplotis TaxID=1664265 RepID=A0ABZ0UL49_9RICK|nr:glycerol-3-phosphate 1-O-acyltransferase PlsY [Candidatus Bandiella woodruffii]WPX96878.1 Glycerol-3-phosphate acyltransferase [Candidatus Bandiella woodruffii]